VRVRDDPDLQHWSGSMSTPDEPAEQGEVAEPEFDDARIAEMRDLSARAGLVDETGPPPADDTTAGTGASQ
jgi:hypothetical protein